MTAFDPTHPRLVAAGRALPWPSFQMRAVARTPSTQDLALAAVGSGAGPGWCVVADEQTAGRGRQGRVWLAPSGSALLVSVVVPAPAGGGWAALAAGVAAAEAIDAVLPATAPPALVKWPNDVLSGVPPWGKLGGLLIEVPPGRAGELLVLGVGVNVTVARFPPGVVGASLHELAAPGPPPRREILLAALLDALGTWWVRLQAADGPEAVAAAWTARAAGLDGTVSAETPTGRVRGVARGLDADGALLVETDGGVVRLLAGDVHLGAGWRSDGGSAGSAGPV